MDWYNYLIGFAQAVVGGIIGAWIVHILDYRKFRKEEKYRDDQKKRDTLRDLLGDVVPDMRTILSIGASQSHNESLLERARELHKRVEVARPLFYGDKEVAEALTGLGNITGTAATPSYTPTAPDFDLFETKVQVLKEELATLEKSLSK
jgi:hypothetical protein